MSNKRNPNLQPQNHSKAAAKAKPKETSYPITKEQAELITSIQTEHEAIGKAAQEQINQSAVRVNLVISGILRGHGIIQAHVLRIDPSKGDEPPRIVVEA